MRFSIFLFIILFASNCFAIGIKPFIHKKPQTLPVMVFHDANGTTHNLNTWKGKVVLLNLWATWCKPCVAEMPLLDRLQEKLKGKVEIIPVSFDRDEQVVKEFYKKMGIIHLPVYLDRSHAILQSIEAVALPTTLVVDKEGKEIARVLGAIEWEKEEVVEYLMKESGFRSQESGK